MRRLVGPLLVVALAGGLVLLGLFPVRTWLDQRQAIADLEHRRGALEAENQALEGEVARLGTDAELERLAREQYGLARPDEEVYHVIPPPEDPVEPPGAWPFDRLGQQLGR